MSPPVPDQAPATSVPEPVLTAAARHGPLSALSLSRWFKDEVQPYDSQLKAYLRRSFPGVRDVDDVVQESYLRVWKAKAAYPIQSPKAFLFTVARRLALRMARRNQASGVQFVEDLENLRVLEECPNPADALGYREKVQLLAEALALLPARCREVVILRKLYSLPQKEVAARLGLSERTVENQLARGVQRCHDFFCEREVRSMF